MLYTHGEQNELSSLLLQAKKASVSKGSSPDLIHPKRRGVGSEDGGAGPPAACQSPRGPDGTPGPLLQKSQRPLIMWASRSPGSPQSIPLLSSKPHQGMSERWDLSLNQNSSFPASATQASLGRPHPSDRKDRVTLLVVRVQKEGFMTGNQNSGTKERKYWKDRDNWDQESPSLPDAPEGWERFC